MSAVMGLVESAWFFRRGRQCVRIVRVDRRGAGLSLVVDGPDSSHVENHFDDSMACAVHQCELERQLVTREFHLERVITPKKSRPVPPLIIPTWLPPNGPVAA
jgi:hypothetical protein